MAKTFIYDLNKCVGCQACVVACNIENKTDTNYNWREVNTFNKFQHPALPVFHLSMACNHCALSPCLVNCPAKAYERDIVTGVVIHYAEKCIGCKYCTWACPYDAPKFNPKKGIVEKCSFCNHRILAGLKPACANLCPTGALDFGEKTSTHLPLQISGFTDADINPSLEIIPLRNNRQLPELDLKEVNTQLFWQLSEESKPKIDIRKEWTLVLFTLIAALLNGIFIAGMFTPDLFNPVYFVGVGLFGLFLSAIHLGKKLRAWRAILNLESSWLSREILLFSIFISLSMVYFYFNKPVIVGWFTVFVGLASLVAIDKVYQIVSQKTVGEFHSANTFLTAVFTASVLIDYKPFWLIFGFTKLVLCLYRSPSFLDRKINTKKIWFSFRLDFLTTYPLILWAFNVSQIWWYWSSFLLGEMMDRIEFYRELQTIEPRKQIFDDMKKWF